jgi:transmembrane sensor
MLRAKNDVLAKERSMKTHPVDHDTTVPESAILQQALEWQMRLEDDTALGPDDPYQDPLVRDRACVDWLKRSERHVRIFMEVMELDRRVGRLAPSHVADLLKSVEVTPATDATPVIPEIRIPEVPAAIRTKSQPVRRWAAPLTAMAAVCAVAAFIGYYLASKPHVFVTRVGERQQQKLKDGSLIDLNTDTRVEVDFLKQARNIRLVRGEALFTVQHNAEQPFTVVSNDCSMRAVGTAFDVRQRPRSTDVAVVSGRVLVAATTREDEASAVALKKTFPQPVTTNESNSQTEWLSAGEMATISSGKVTRIVDGNVKDALSWQQDRLVFRNTRLADVAEQFNRYNHTQIRVEGDTAKGTPLTGAYDTGGYQAVLQYARTKEFLSVTQDGNDWVIRARH